MSDIVPGQIADQDEPPKRMGSNKNAPLHQNNVLKDFIKNRLLKEHFCVVSEIRNNEAKATGAEIRDNAADLAESSGSSLPPSKSTFEKFIPRKLSPLEAAWDKLQNAYKPPGRKKTSVYRPLCKFLTFLAESRYLFIPWDNKTAGEDEESFRQDILAVNAQRKDIDKFLHGDLALSDLPDEFHYRDEDKVRYRVYYSDIQMVGEVKPGDAPESAQECFDHATQVLKYLFTTSQYQPRHAYHIGFLAYRNGFVIIEYYPDRAFFSHLFAWDDPDAQIALQKAIDDIQDRKFTTKQFESINATLRHDKSRLRFCLSGKFTHADAVYRLFDLHRGEGWHRNAYVGIGVGEQIDTRSDWKVIKHYWHDMGRPFNELHILQYIYQRPLTSGEKRCTTGIVRVNFNESRVLMRGDTPGSSGSSTDRDHVPRQSILLVMESLGHALSSCPSVMQFLKAMYDLVEVHRMLVEDHQVLHRDISWGNVLINATHVDKNQQDDLCDRPFIDMIHDVKPEARKVHVMLSDFHCACILGNSKMRESTTRGEITGTPMFMARSLCSRRLESAQNIDPSAVCELVFPKGATGPTDQRQKEVEQFLEIVNEYRNLLFSKQIPSISRKPQSGIAHEPMHDVESIFWLIVVFFLRAHPKDYDHTDLMSGERERRRNRTDAFKSMVMNGIETGHDSRKAPGADSLPPQFHPFVEMLVNLDIYFRQSWHDPFFSTLASNKAFRFHAHNALQVVLLDAINKLQTTGDYIEIHATPLGVDDDFPYIPLSKSFVSANLKRGIPDEGEGDKKAKKKQKTTQVTKTSSPMITKSNMDNTAEIIEKNPEFKTLMSAIDHDKQSKRWFMGDREYVEYAFVA